MLHGPIVTTRLNDYASDKIVIKSNTQISQYIRAHALNVVPHLLGFDEGCYIAAKTDISLKQRLANTLEGRQQYVINNNQRAELATIDFYDDHITIRSVRTPEVLITINEHLNKELLYPTKNVDLFRSTGPLSIFVEGYRNNLMAVNQVAEELEPIKVPAKPLPRPPVAKALPRPPVAQAPKRRPVPNTALPACPVPNAAENEVMISVPNLTFTSMGRPETRQNMDTLRRAMNGRRHLLTSLNDIDVDLSNSGSDLKGR